MCATCERLQEHGYFIQYVAAEDDRNPSFAYTVGLCLVEHPEFIVFSMHPDCAAAALEPIVHAVLAGRDFDEGDNPSDLYPFDEPTVLLGFPDSSTHLCVANDLFRWPGAPPIPALQLLWPGEIPLLQRRPEPPARAIRQRKRRPRSR